MHRLALSVTVNDFGEVEVTFIEGKNEYRQRKKGKSLLQFPKDLVVIDIETTGLDPEFCEIIEVAAIKIRDNQEVDHFETLVKPIEEVDSFITKLTGITNDMLSCAPTPDSVFPKLIGFIGEDTIVAHNAHFDINFLYDYFELFLSKEFNNNFICTMRLCRRIFPELQNHKLYTLCNHFCLSEPSHRALNDAKATLQLFNICKQTVEQTIGFEDFAKQTKKPHLKASTIAPETDVFDKDHPLFGKSCVFTGTLTKMVRQEAMQLVVNLGGNCTDGITRNTDYLIMGIQDYSKFTDGQKGNKLKKAEELIQKGFGIEIISENVFYDLIFENALYAGNISDVG